MKPRLIPNSRLSTFAVTESAFVVQDPLLMMECFFGSYSSWLTPMFSVMSSPFAGDLMTTFFVTPFIWSPAFSSSEKRPVDSTTTSTPADFHDVVACSRDEHTLHSRSSTRC